MCKEAGLVTGYRLTYTTDNNPVQLEIPDSNTTMALLEGLTPQTAYRVEVMVLAANGKDSLPSSSVEITTKDSGRSHNFVLRVEEALKFCY